MGALIARPGIQVPVAIPLIGAALAIAALFAVNARLRRTHSQSFPSNWGAPHVDADLKGPLVHLLSYPGASNRWTEDLVFTGPRLTMIGLDHLRRTQRLLNLDVDVCAKLLATLAPRRKKVLLAELAEVSGIARIEHYAQQLMDIRGVFLLRNEPVGYCLSRDLRREVLDLSSVVSEDEDDVEVTDTSRERVPGPAGINQSATLEEFEAAYRAWLRENPEVRRGGRQQKDPNAEAVKAAYETFVRERGLKCPGAGGRKVEQVWEKYKPSGT
jgi:hypothetical protein